MVGLRLFKWVLYSVKLDSNVQKNAVTLEIKSSVYSRISKASK